MDQKEETRQNKKGKNWFLHHKVLTIIIVLIILAIIGAASSSGDNNANNNSSTANASSKSASNSQSSSVAKIGQQANDGKLGFTITSFNCGVAQIEQPNDSEEVSTSGAPYCVMNLSIKGVGTQAQNFDTDSQYLFSANGTKYSVDDSATIDANDVSSNCMEDPTVNPGVTITCTLAYDVPASVTPAYAMMHDSELSNGVKIDLQ